MFPVPTFIMLPCKFFDKLAAILPSFLCLWFYLYFAFYFFLSKPLTHFLCFIFFFDYCCPFSFFHLYFYLSISDSSTYQVTLTTDSLVLCIVNRNFMKSQKHFSQSSDPVFTLMYLQVVGCFFSNENDVSMTATWFIVKLLCCFLCEREESDGRQTGVALLCRCCHHCCMSHLIRPLDFLSCRK